jgi:hypothetical protein
MLRDEGKMDARKTRGAAHPTQDAYQKWGASYELKLELQVQVMRLLCGANIALDCQEYALVHTTPHLSYMPNAIMSVKPS